MMGMRTIIIGSIALIMLIAAAVLIMPQFLQDADKPLVDKCIAACQDYLATGNSLDVGPCLLDPINGTEWVCDVAHSPRLSIDNMEENQCSAYLDGIATHFIEITPGCELIRKN